MKKTVFLINAFGSGGAERALLNLLKNLPFDKAFLIVLEKNVFYELPEKLNVRFFSKNLSNVPAFFKFFLLFFYAFKLKNYIRQNDVEIVQSNLMRAHYVNIIAKLLGSKHEVQVVNPIILSYFKKKGISGKISLILIKFLYKFADVIVNKSVAMQEDMHVMFSFDAKKVVINNSYDTDYIEEMCEKAVEDKGFEFNTSKKYLIYVGRLAKQKRITDLIKALKEIRKEQSNVELLLVGRAGNDHERIINCIQDNGLKKEVHLLGEQKNPFKYVRRSAIFVSASENEGFPNAIVEALVCGTPVISTDCLSGPREILAPGTTLDPLLSEGIQYTDYGVLVPVGSPDLVAEAVCKLLSDDNLINKLRQSGKERAKEFSIKNIVSKYKEILE